MISFDLHFHAPIGALFLYIYNYRDSVLATKTWSLIFFTSGLRDINFDIFYFRTARQNIEREKEASRRLATLMVNLSYWKIPYDHLNLSVGWSVGRLVG